MALSLNEIVPGVVAYFDHKALNTGPGVVKPASPATISGPFLCFAVGKDTSGWAPLTTEQREDDRRIEIRKEWRSGGMGKWLTEAQFLSDGSTTYVGPNAAFVSASTIQDRVSTQQRPRVLKAGVDAVLAEIKTRGGHMPHCLGEG